MSARSPHPRNRAEAICVELRMALSAALRTLALDHDGILVTADFRVRGLDRHAVHRLVRAGDLIPVGRGVHRVSTHPLTMRARVRLSAHRAGRAAIVSGHAAARWWGAIDTPPGQITLTMPPGYRRDVAGARIRYRAIPAVDTAVVAGLAVTSRPLSVLEAGVENGIGHVDAALLCGRVTEAELRAAYRRRRGCEDAVAMARLLAGVGEGARSAAERATVHLFRGAGITGWIANHPCLNYLIDFAFVDERVAIEIDGMAYHRTAKVFQRDRRRRNDLIAAGWTVLNFTWSDLVDRPAYVIDRVRRALAAAVA